MNKSIIDIIKLQNSKYRKFLIMNNSTYQLLKRELGMEDFEELINYKNLIICISLDDSLTLIVS
jgi:hypothetical protein